MMYISVCFFFSSRRRHTRLQGDWSSDVCSSDLAVFEAIEKTLAVLRKARERLGIALSSSVNLFIANGSQLAAVRYCFDFGCYRTDDPARVHEEIGRAHV